MIATPVPAILLATANDRDDRARYLRNLAEEARQVQRALAAAEQRGHCELVSRQNATAGDILDVFQDARYRDRIVIFHFGGHADGYRLLLETAAGAPAAANAGGLARFLAQQRGLQLVFLNGCSTEGQVVDLLAAGVPAVIATDQAVDDAQATAFAARFYRGLAGGASIAAAYDEARADREMAGAPIYRHLGAAEVEPDADRLPWHLHVRPGAEIARDWSLPLAAGDPLFGLPALPPLDLPDKPYRNLDWYRREDAPIFFGRGEEIRDLYHKVMAEGAPPLVLFYGQSGVGKSSLLAAGLLPRLESSHVVRYVRRDQAPGLLGTLAAALGAAPDADLPAAWHAVEAQAGRPLLVVLDQVEEVFTRANKEQPDELPRFLDGLQALFADIGRRPQGRLILSFRKEWLAELRERLAERHLPRGEVFLERLGREGTAEVMAGAQSTPRLSDHYRLSVDVALPGLVADDLLADRESPVAPMLAILLADMWEAAKARSYDRPAFDADLYHEFRSRGLSLDDFLGRQLRALHDKQPEVVASGLALDVLAHHTTPLGTAEQRTLADLERTYSHRRDALPALVQVCRDLYLLVDPAQNRPDQPRASRLTHDTLAPHVRKRFDESVAPGQQARRILESRAVQWRNGQSGPVLDGPDLAAVEAGRSGMRAWDEEKGETKLVQASQAARQKQRRQRWLVSSAFLALAAIMLLAANWDALKNLWLRYEALRASPQTDIGNIKVDLYEVSIALYDRCHRAAPARCPAPEGSEAFLHFQEGLTHKYDDLPVTNVSGLTAAHYCQWLGRRLPTSAEWQTAAAQVYADRLQADGRTLTSVDGLNLGSSVLEPVSEAGTQSRDTGEPRHLIGNVWEWTRSLEANDGAGDASAIWNGADASASLILRGGSSESASLDDLTALWTTASADYPNGEDIGFRCISERPQ